MLDWQVEEESKEGAEERVVHEPVRRRWFWRGLLGLTLLLLIGGGVLLRQREERYRVMRADLEAFIRYEEQQRLFGQRQVLPQLVTHDSSEGWRTAYQGTFREGEGRVEPVEVALEEVTFEAGAALVRVRLEEQLQLRHYRLTGQGWRRAPLQRGQWGAWHERSVAGLTLRYRARDELYAERLATELPALLAHWPETRRQRITLRPREFGPPLLERGEEEIVLNSPLLARSAEGVPGEEAVRLVLAHELLQQASRTGAEPDVLSFRTAARMVLLSRWALSPSYYEALRQRWQEEVQIASILQSPFLASHPPGRQVRELRQLWYPSANQATLLLVADYLYQERGAPVLLTLAEEAAGATSWDELFRSHLGQYTFQLETAFWRALAVDESRTVLEEGELEGELPTPPFTLTVQGRLHADKTLLLEVEQENGAGFKLDTTDATLITPEGYRLHGSCAALHGRLTAEAGNWLDGGKQFRATEIIGHGLNFDPFSTLEKVELPPDALAYFFQAESQVAPDLRQWTLVAIDQEGELIELARTETLPVAGRWEEGEPAPDFLFYFRDGVAGCKLRPLLQASPDEGTRWVVDPHWYPGGARVRPIWRNSVEDLILFRTPGESDWEAGGYYELKTDGGARIELIAAGAPGRPLGWSATHRQLITMLPGQYSTQIGSIPLDRNVSAFSFSLSLSLDRLRYCCVLDSTGERLLYTLAPSAGQAGGIYALELATQEQALVLPAKEGEIFHFERPPSADGSWLIRSIPEHSLAAETAVSLLLVNLDRPTQSVTVATEQELQGQRLEHAQRCGDGRVLYTTSSEHPAPSQVTLYLWHPDGTTRRLYEWSTNFPAFLLCEGASTG